MTAHHLLSPSSAARWFACPGSAQAEAAYPRTENAYSAEGSEIHDLAAHCLETGKDAADVTDVVDRQAIIQAYIDYVRQHLGDGVQYMVEVKVDLGHISEGMFGTADCVILDATAGTVHVIDLKAGQVKVDAINNAQLMTYASGVIHQYGWMADWQQAVCHIVQPRIDHIESDSVPITAVDEFTLEARRAAAVALEPDPPKHPSHDACRWCKHAGDCTALRIKTYTDVCQMFEDSAELEPDDVSEYDHDTLAAKLKAVPLIKAWLTAVEDRAYATLEDGGDVPGWKLVEGRKLRRWKDAQAAEDALRRKKFKVRDIFKSTLISPAQAEKLLGKGNPLLDDLVETPTGKPTLAPASDKRPDIRRAAADNFDNLDQHREAI